MKLCKYFCTRISDERECVCAVTRDVPQPFNLTGHEPSCQKPLCRHCFNYKVRSHTETKWGIPTDYTGLKPLKEVPNAI